MRPFRSRHRLSRGGLSLSLAVSARSPGPPGLGDRWPRLAGTGLRDRRHHDQHAQAELPGPDAPVMTMVVLGVLGVFATGSNSDPGRGDHHLYMLGVGSRNRRRDAQLTVAFVDVGWWDSRFHSSGPA